MLPRGSRRRKFSVIESLAWAYLALACVGCSAALQSPNSPVQEAQQPLRFSADFSEAERAHLVRGDSVKRPMVLEQGAQRYIGGVAYQIVDAPAPVIYRALANTEAIARVLPRTKRASLVTRAGIPMVSGSGIPDFSREEAPWVEIEQGNAWLTIKYTIALEEFITRNGTRGMGFRLEPSQPHDIDDVRGYFSVEPILPERSLVALAAFVSMGSVLAFMFERRVQDAILNAPGQLKRHFSPEALAVVNHQPR